MAQILKFDDDANVRDMLRQRAVARARKDEDESYSFWQEISCGWPKRPADLGPRNSPQQTVSEMMLIAGGAGLLVLLTTIFLGTSST